MDSCLLVCLQLPLHQVGQLTRNKNVQLCISRELLILLMLKHLLSSVV